jgi:hypothetical protein
VAAIAAADESVKISHHPDTSNNQFPQIAVDGKGNAYVVWMGFDGTDSEIYWTKIESGIPGDVIKVSTHKDNVNWDDYNPQIAVDVAGNSYITWYGHDGTDSEIYWVKVVSGVPGAVVKVSIEEENIRAYDRNSQIAVDAVGNSYVVWSGYGGPDQDIYWVKIDASNNPGNVQVISTHRDNIVWNDYNPQIAVDAVGNSYVVWHGYDGTDQEVYWTKVVSGVPGNVQMISTHKDNVYEDDYNPQIAVDAVGNSYITWYGYDGTDQEVYWTKVVSGVPGNVQMISTHLDNTYRNDYNPHIAADNAGTSYVVWTGFDGIDQDIYWVRITASGTLVIKVSTHKDNLLWDDYNPHIAADNAGTSYVVWSGFDGIDQDIYWRRITAYGPEPVKKIFHENTIDKNDYNPSIAADAAGNSYVVWSGFDGINEDIYFVVPTLYSIDNEGPITFNVSTKSYQPHSAHAVLSAIISDSKTGNSVIKAAEYFIDEKRADGTGISMEAADGTFDSPQEMVRAVVDVSTLSAGVHIIYIHGQDTAGNWGPVQKAYLRVFHIGIE